MRRIVLFSTLYPSSARPGHGLFVETRLRELLRSGEVEAKVVAPVPWFHSTDLRHGDKARMALTPARETRAGIDVLHPRYLLPPKVGQNLAPWVLAFGALPAFRRLRREGFEFDLIDAHYFYPDGVAAALLAAWLRKPLVITARGSDLNVLGNFPLARRLMQWAASRAAASIGVCQALVEVLRDWQVDPARLHVIRNGVDLQRFRPWPQAQARARLGLGDGPMLLSVGNLVEVKGHDLSIEALALLQAAHPGLRLYLVGQGPLLEQLRAQAHERGLDALVHFVGALPNDQLAPWYSAADALVLASRSEGWANVLLEAMACGTPVVATDVGGSPEVVTEDRAGRLVRQRDAPSLAAAVGQVLARPPDRHEVRRYAERFSWEETTKAQLQLFHHVAAGPC